MTAAFSWMPNPLIAPCVRTSLVICRLASTPLRVPPEPFTILRRDAVVDDGRWMPVYGYPAKLSTVWAW